MPQTCHRRQAAAGAEVGVIRACRISHIAGGRVALRRIGPIARPARLVRVVIRGLVPLVLGGQQPVWRRPTGTGRGAGDGHRAGVLPAARDGVGAALRAAVALAVLQPIGKTDRIVPGDILYGPVIAARRHRELGPGRRRGAVVDSTANRPRHHVHVIQAVLVARQEDQRANRRRDRVADGRQLGVKELAVLGIGHVELPIW